MNPNRFTLPSYDLGRCRFEKLGEFCTKNKFNRPKADPGIREKICPQVCLIQNLMTNISIS